MKRLTSLLVALFCLVQTTFAAKSYTLLWDPSPDAVNGYNVYQSIGTNSTSFVKIGTTNALMFPLGTLSTNYYPQKLMFTANSTQTILSFADVSPATDAVDGGIDNVRIYRVLAP